MGGKTVSTQESADFKEVGHNCLVEGWDCLIALMERLDEGDNMTKEMRDASPSPTSLEGEQTVGRSRTECTMWGSSHELREAQTSQRH